MPIKLSQFWQELKRRNVVRVITVYAGAAFVIIELINNITEPLRLPEWTPTFVIVLLAIGFPVIIIFSWIYDLHPEGGMVKTEPDDKIKPEDAHKSSSGWKIASYISFVVIVGLIVLNIVPRTDRSGKGAGLETSIAVLPFENMSLNEEDYYIGGAFTDEIIMELQKISAFDRVLSRTSTMQYEENRPTIPEIAEKLNVNYIIEGSIQRLAGRVRIRVQVIRADNEDHIWGESYDEDYTKPEDILDIQSRIAHSVADELKVRITPEELERIESISTTNLSAYDFYQRGNEAYWSYWSDNRDTLALERAEYYFKEALKYDPTFAQAYTGLARIYWGIEGYFSEGYLDTTRVLLDKALSFNPELAEAHTLYGSYFNTLNDTIRAMREVDKAIALNPNDWEAYREKARISTDYINKILNSQKAVQLNRGRELPTLLRNLTSIYWNIGFPEKAAVTSEEVLKLTGDSVRYFIRLGGLEVWNGSFNAGIAHFENAFALDSTNGNAAYGLYMTYSILGEKEQALKYGKRWMELMDLSGGTGVYFMHRTGYYYWLKGMEEEADYFFKLQIDYGMREIELERDRAERDLGTYYDLAATYAFTGDAEKAIENLRIYISRPVMDNYMLGFFKYDPLFKPIRDNPDFQQILREAQDSYDAEHERVRQWLEENGML